MLSILRVLGKFPNRITTPLFDTFVQLLLKFGRKSKKSFLYRQIKKFSAVKNIKEIGQVQGSIPVALVGV